MTDTASSILLLRLQSTGSNTNLWGGYLNTAMQTLERASKGYQAYTVTGDETIDWSNYSASNDLAVAFVKFIGTPTSASTLTMGGRHHFVDAWNAIGQNLTIKCSGGTGVTLADGQRALLYCDGTDYFNAAPTLFPAGITIAGQIKGVTAGTSATDAVNKTQMETAIATAGLPATAGTVLVSLNDTTSGYIGQKITTNLGGLTTTQVSGLTSLQISVQNSGSDEKLLFTVGEGYVGGFLDGGLKTSQFTPVVGTAYDCDTTAAAWTLNLSGMTTPQLGQSIQINKFGNFPLFLLGTVNGQTNLVLDITDKMILRYCGSSWGWN